MLWRRPFFVLSYCIPTLPSPSSFYSSCKRTPRSVPPHRPPIPKRIPFAASAHGRKWDDPYHWMSNTSNPDLIDYLNRENAYTDAFMADTVGLRRQLVDEMRSRMPPSIATPPESWGPWLYYEYIPEGKEYPILCRRLRSQNGFGKALLNYLRGSGKEEILLDWNEIAEQFGYVHVGTCRVSSDHKFLAYTLDTTGAELFTLQVKDLTTGNIIPNSRVQRVVSLAWSRDSCHLLYTVCDETMRPHRVFCTKLGSDMDDCLLFTEDDLSCCVDITSTKDGKFITINSNSRNSSEVYVIDAANLQDGPWLVRKRAPGVQYFLEHHYGFFYVLTNAPSKNEGPVAESYYLSRFKAQKSPLAQWQVIILPGQDMTFKDMDVFHKYLVLFVEKKGFSSFCSIDMPIHVNHEEPVDVEDLNPWFFPLPSSINTIFPGSNHDFLTSIYRLVISSPLLPDVTVDYDMTNRTFTVLSQGEVVGLKKDAEMSSFIENSLCGIPQTVCYDHSQLQGVKDSQKWGNLSEAFTCLRKEVVSHDGVSVPLTIVCSRESQFKGQSPGILHGYGAYGEVLDKSWSSDQISLIARGWVLAYADVRYHFLISAARCWIPVYLSLSWTMRSLVMLGSQLNSRLFAVIPHMITSVLEFVIHQCLSQHHS